MYLGLHRRSGMCWASNIRTFRKVQDLYVPYFMTLSQASDRAPAIGRQI